MKSSNIIAALRAFHRNVSEAGRILKPFRDSGVITDDRASLGKSGVRFATVVVSDASKLSDEDKAKVRKAAKLLNLANAFMGETGVTSADLDQTGILLEAAEAAAKPDAAHEAAKVKKAA